MIEYAERPRQWVLAAVLASGLPAIVAPSSGFPAPSSTFKSGPVTVRPVFEPRDGRTLEQALALFVQGYTPTDVSG